MDRLTEMEAFAAVVREGAFTDAARKLGMSKSAVSKHVASLETRLGVRLLNRSTRRVSPTALGLAYYDRAALLLLDLAVADAAVGAVADRASGRVRLGVTRDLLPSLWQGLLPDVLRRFPAMALQIRPFAAGAPPQPVDCDLALCLGAPPAAGWQAQYLRHDRLRWVVSRGYIGRQGLPRGLAGQRVIHYPLVPKPKAAAVLQLDDGAMALDAALADLGVAQLPQAICGFALQAGLLHEVMADLPPDDLPLYLLLPVDRLPAPDAAALAAALQVHFTGPQPQAISLRHGG